MENIEEYGYLFVHFAQNIYVLWGRRTLDGALKRVNSWKEHLSAVGAKFSSWRGIATIIGNEHMVLGYWVPEDVTPDELRSFLRQEDAATGITTYLDAFERDPEVEWLPTQANVSDHPLGEVIQERRLPSKKFGWLAKAISWVQNLFKRK